MDSGSRKQRAWIEFNQTHTLTHPQAARSECECVCVWKLLSCTFRLSTRFTPFVNSRHCCCCRYWCSHCTCEWKRIAESNWARHTQAHAHAPTHKQTICIHMHSCIFVVIFSLFIYFFFPFSKWQNLLSLHSKKIHLNSSNQQQWKATARTVTVKMRSTAKTAMKATTARQRRRRRHTFYVLCNFALVMSGERKHTRTHIYKSRDKNTHTRSQKAKQESLTLALATKLPLLLTPSYSCLFSLLLLRLLTFLDCAESSLCEQWSKAMQNRLK